MIKYWGDSEILRLYSEGKSGRQVWEELRPPITVRQVQRIIERAGISRPRAKGIKRQPGDNLKSIMREICWQLMIERGDDPKVCALCGSKGKMTIHHTRYEGATLKDLVFACWNCQQNPINKGLA